MSSVISEQNKCGSLIKRKCIFFASATLLVLASTVSMQAYADEAESNTDDPVMSEKMEASKSDAVVIGKIDGMEDEYAVTNEGECSEEALLDNRASYGSFKWGTTLTGYADTIFSFRLPYASRVTFYPKSVGHVTYSIWDNNNDKIDSFDSYAMHSVCLGPDSYTLEITSYSTDIKYKQFSFSAYHNDYDEDEYHGNTSSSRPYSLPLNEMHASVKPKNDRYHYYSFYVPEAGRYKFYGNLSATLSKKNGKETFENSETEEDWYSKEVDLTPGEYVMKISGYPAERFLEGRYWCGMECVKASGSGSSPENSSDSNQGNNSGSAVMYRLYNPNSGEHFYTADRAERDHLRSVGWRYEGHAWNAPKTGDPVYRMYNPNAGDHHYTISKAERDSLRKAGWRYEGVGWYSDSNKKVPLYRLYNPHAIAGAHHYTTSAAERNHLKSVGWFDERIGWYGCN